MSEFTVAEKKPLSENKRLRLYSYWRSSCSWRVRIALELKGIEYEITPVHLVKNGGEQKSESYVAKNPMKQVPTLEITEGDNITFLTQSVAIIEYLEEESDSTFKLLPKTCVERAKARGLVELINAGIQPIQNLSVLNHAKAVANVDEEDKAKVGIDWGCHFISEGFDALEKQLQAIYKENPAGQFCMGNEISIVDCFLVPQVYNANRFKVDMSRYPRISMINDYLSTLPQFKSAHPDAQPDAQ